MHKPHPVQVGLHDCEPLYPKGERHDSKLPSQTSGASIIRLPQNEENERSAPLQSSSIPLPQISVVALICPTHEPHELLLHV